MIRLSVLGPVRAQVAGTTVDLGGPRQRAVLARLVSASGQVVSTERFIDDLWCGEPPPKALAALQVYVSQLRKILEPDRPPRAPANTLVTAPPGYLLQLPRDAVDAWRFADLIERAAAEPQPDRAIELYERAAAEWQGAAYAEFADEPWAAPEVEQLEELRRVAVERRADALLRTGRSADAVAALDPLVRAYPLREESTRLLALALYRAGRQADALTTLRAARTRLAEDLGVDPSPPLRALEVALLRQDPELDVPAPERVERPRSAVAPPPRRDTLVGRERELAVVTDAATIAARGSLRVVWIGGEAGAGKSTLVAAASERLAANGWVVAHGRCPELDGAPPAWAWSEVVQCLADELPDDLRRRLEPLLRQEAEPSTDAALPRFWLARALADLLRLRSDRAPLAVVLDDVHRADGETLQLLRQIAADLTDRPILLVATYRTVEITDEGRAARAALAGPTTDRLELAGLTEPDVAELLRRYGGPTGAHDPATVRLVTTRTGGNPLFVCETARLIAAEGTEAAATVVPAGVSDVLRRRLARLPGDCRATLRTASVVGLEWDVDLLLALGDDEEAVLDALEAGVVTGLLSEPAPGRVRFAHVLVRDTLYADIPQLRRVRMHHRVLRALEAHRPDDVAALAHHALAGATPPTAHRAAELAAAAADAASALHAHREAASLRQRALAALDTAPGADDRLRLRLLCGSVSALGHAGDVLGARAVRGEAILVARHSADRAALAAAYTAYDAPTLWSVLVDAQPDAELIAELQALLDDCDDEPTRCRLLATLGLEIDTSDVPRADRVTAEAAAIARRLGDPGLLCRALGARYFVAHTPSRRAELAAVGTEMLAASAAAGLPGYQAQAHHALYQAALGANDLDLAGHHATQAVKHSTSSQLGLALGVVELFDGLRRLVGGDPDRAEQRYRAAMAQVEGSGSPNAEGMTLLLRFCVEHARPSFDPAVAGELADFAAGQRERLGPALDELYTRLLVLAGRPDDARRGWRPEVPVPEDYYWLMWMVLRAENAIGVDRRDVAEQCYRALLPWAGQLAGASAGAATLGPVDHTLGQLADHLGRHADAARHYRAALVVAETVGAPHWAERSRAAIRPLTRR